MKKTLFFILAMIANTASATVFDGTYTTRQNITANSTFEDNAVVQNVNSSNNGGGAYINNNINVEIKNGVQFLNNQLSSSSYNGAGIYNYGTLNISGDNVLFQLNRTYSTSGGYGGAIYNFNSRQIIINGDYITFDQNRAGQGGAIYNYGGGVLTINGNESLFSNNQASSGGAIYNDVDSYGTNYYNGILTIRGIGTVFSGNTATTNGGALYNRGIVNFDKAIEFNGNTANYGGAIGNTPYGNSTASVKIGAGSQFIGNTATTNGGAIYNSGYVLIGNGTVFNGNTATTNGGAIYNSPSNQNGNFGIVDINTGTTSVDFLTATDSIYNSNGTINFLGTGTVNAGLTSLTSVRATMGYTPTINLGKASLVFNTVILQDNTLLKTTVWNNSGTITAGNIAANTFNLQNTNELKLQIAVENRNILSTDGAEITILIDRTGAQAAGWDAYGNPARQPQYTLANNLLYDIEFISDGVYKITPKAISAPGGGDGHTPPDGGNGAVIDNTPNVIGDMNEKDIEQANFDNASTAWGEDGFITGSIAESIANQLYIYQQFVDTLPDYEDGIHMLSPSQNNLLNRTAQNTTRTMFGTIADRMSEDEAGFWTKGFYSSFNNSGDKWLEFSGNTGGLMFGQDIKIGKFLKMGEVFTYSQTKADEYNRAFVMNGAYNIALYGMLELPVEIGDFYIDAIFNYGAYTAREDKTAVGYNISSDLAATALSTQVVGGFKTNLGGKNSLSTEFGFSYMNIEQAAYTDTIGQRVSSGTADIQTLLGTIKYKNELIRWLTFGAKLGLELEMNKDPYEYIVTPPNGVHYRYRTMPDTDVGLTFGANIDFSLTGAVKFGVAYTGAIKGDYTEHNGGIRFNWQW
jgi:predicted outer membrane repeat protein